MMFLAGLRKPSPIEQRMIRHHDRAAEPSVANHFKRVHLDDHAWPGWLTLKIRTCAST